MKKKKSEQEKRHPKDIPTHYMYLEPDEVPEIITREEWGALPFTSSEHVDIPYVYVRFQCTGKETCTSKEDCIKFVQNMQKDHMENLKLPDIQFNYLISPEGYIFEGRGWFRDAYREGKHVTIYKHRFLNIGFIGDYLGENVLPMKLEAAVIELIKYAWLKEYFNTEPIPINHKVGNIDFTYYY